MSASTVQQVGPIAPGATNGEPKPLRWVMLTPSYAPDLERCRILCHSIDLCIPDDVPHLLIVDRCDLEAFSSLVSPRRRILVSEDLLPWWIRRLPIGRRWWINLRGRPIRSWVLQQILKIKAAATVDADAVLFLDSDVTFLRPFSPHQLEMHGKVALNRVPFSNDQHEIWLKNAAVMIGVQRHQHGINYIGNLVSWRVDMAQALIRRLASIRNRHWILEFTSYWQVSEYMVYGTFVDHLIGIDAAGHFPSAMPLIHLSWGHNLSEKRGVQTFFDALAPEQVAIMIHSKNGIDPSSYLPYVQRHWDRLVDRSDLTQQHVGHA